MKINEILLEKNIGNLTIGDIKVSVDDHTIQRCIQRNISPLAVDKVLKKLPTVKDQLSRVDSGQQFWIWDQSLDIGLGLRRISSDYLGFVLKTVLDRHPWDSTTPIIKI